MKGRVRRIVLAVGWLGVVALISLGAAGIVTGMAHQPGTASRAELTYAGDRAIEPGLATIAADLPALSADLRQLSDLGRGALSALVSNDVETLGERVADGEELALAIQLQANDLRGRLEALPGLGRDAELTVSPDVRRKHALVTTALESTEGIAPAWTRLASSAFSATSVSVLLTDHDATTAAAAADGRGGRYAEALAKLDESDDLIARARSLRDELAATVDVSTLTTWLDLNADYDEALRALYQSILDSNGRVTDEVRAAFAAEAEAKERLPEDTRAFVIILLDVARGGLNGAVIAIEEARGQLDGAIGELGLDAAPSPAP
jgi:hypothetical protein